MHLDIFDFDDTLCKTESEIFVTNKETGESESYDSIKWKNHKVNYDKYDYVTDQFSSLGNHKPIKQILNIAKKSYNTNGPDGLIILTARDVIDGPSEFLDLYNLTDVKVIAIGQAANVYPGKAKWIESLIHDLNLTSIRYFEDSAEQIQYAKKYLRKNYPNVKLKIIKVNI